MPENLTRPDESGTEPNMAAALAAGQGLSAGPFKPFIARHARRIVEEMHKAGLCPATAPEGLPDMYDRLNLQLPRAADAVFPFSLNAAPALRTKNGSLIFPCPAPEAECAWCVFAINSSKLRTEYEFRGGLAPALRNHDFLKRAHEILLPEQNISAAAASCLKLLDSGQMSRHDLFVSLLNAEILINQRGKFLVMPMPGSWQELAALPLDAKTPQDRG